MSESRIRFRVRTYAGESGFVAGTWLRSYLSSPWGKRVEQDEFYRCHPRLVSQLIDRSHVFVAESTEPDSEGLLLGYAVGERDELGPVVHYAYTKGDFRRAGIGRALVRALFDSLRVRDDERVRYTHSRAPGSEIAGRLGWTYTPYPALRFGWDNR